MQRTVQTHVIIVVWVCIQCTQERRLFVPNPSRTDGAEYVVEQCQRVDLMPCQGVESFMYIHTDSYHNLSVPAHAVFMCICMYMQLVVILSSGVCSVQLVLWDHYTSLARLWSKVLYNSCTVSVCFILCHNDGQCIYMYIVCTLYQTQVTVHCQPSPVE